MKLRRQKTATRKTRNGFLNGESLEQYSFFGNNLQLDLETSQQNSIKKSPFKKGYHTVYKNRAYSRTIRQKACTSHGRRGPSYNNSVDARAATAVDIEDHNTSLPVVNSTEQTTLNVALPAHLTSAT